MKTVSVNVKKYLPVSFSDVYPIAYTCNLLKKLHRVLPLLMQEQGLQNYLFFFDLLGFNKFFCF